MNNPPYTSASLYVGDLDYDVSEPLLFELFNTVGPVASIRVCRDAISRRSLGYAYVNFHNVVDAERALDTMNYTLIRNRQCRIMWSQRDPSLRKSGLGNIFVKNLDKSIDSKTLYDTFSMFGDIISCKVAFHKDRAESLGYGFVHYETEEAAQKAIEQVNGMFIAQVKVQVEPFKPRHERARNANKFTNVYVKNLPPMIDDSEKLNHIFQQYGTITNSMVALDDAKRSRGFGFVNFETHEEACGAINGLNDTDYEGKKLYVGVAQTRSERDKELKERFEKMKLEQQKKYAGVNLYIKNLPEEWDDGALRQEFDKFGTITSAKIMRETSTGRSKGFGFVCFSSPEEATKAVNDQNGQMYRNKPLYVALAQPKEMRRMTREMAQRNKVLAGPIPGQPGAPLYPPVNGAPVFYRPIQPGMAAPHMVYPGMSLAPGPAQGPRRWTHQQQMGMMPPSVRPQQVPAAAYMAGTPMTAPARPTRQTGVRNQTQFKYVPNVRNRDVAAQPIPPQQIPPPAGPPMHPMGTAQMQAPMSQQAQAPPPPPGHLTAEMLANADAQQQKQMIGERLFPLITSHQPQRAGKITGMLLEMDNGELLHLLESKDALQEKIHEAVMVLQEHETRAAAAAAAGGAAAENRAT